MKCIFRVEFIATKFIDIEVNDQSYGTAQNEAQWMLDHSKVSFEDSDRLEVGTIMLKP